jgi:two-component system response regulator NreC
MNVKILIADDHKIMRDGLRHLLEKEAGMEVVAEAKDGHETIQIAEQLRPDIIIMDISMAGMNGMDATRYIVEKNLGSRIIALSMHADKRFVAGMFEAGAMGYLLKDCAYDELVKAIRQVLSGSTYLCSMISGVVIRDYVQRLRKNKPELLSLREKEILQLMAEGHATKQIADKLRVSIKTVETHRQHIMTKLNIFNIAELTKYAVREGITSLDSR